MSSSQVQLSDFNVVYVRKPKFNIHLGIIKGLVNYMRIKLRIKLSHPPPQRMQFDINPLLNAMQSYGIKKSNRIIDQNLKYNISVKLLASKISNNQLILHFLLKILNANINICIKFYKSLDSFLPLRKWKNCNLK